MDPAVIKQIIQKGHRRVKRTDRNVAGAADIKKAASRKKGSKSNLLPCPTSDNVECISHIETSHQGMQAGPNLSLARSMIAGYATLDPTLQRAILMAVDKCLHEDHHILMHAHR